MVLVEVPLDQPQILGVGAEQEIEQVAGDRDGAERAVDADIGEHARDRRA